MYSKFISVATNHGEAVQAYLYDHTREVGRATAASPFGRGDTSLLILETCADTEDRAEYLATYQAERLASGMHAARVFDTYENANDHLASAFGQDVERLA